MRLESGELVLVADLIQQKRSEENKKIIIPFNKDLLVRAVDTYVYPLANTATDLQKAVYSVRNAKMEIYEIRNLCLLDEDGTSNGGSRGSCSPGSSGSFIK